MGFYKTPADMFEHRAKTYQKRGDQYWARATNGEGGQFYTKARECYAEAEKNREKAKNARETGATF